MSEKNNFALVPRPPSAVERVVPAARRIVTLMVTETLALAQARIQTQSLSALQPYASADLESWFQKGTKHEFRRDVADYAQAVHWYRKAAEQGHAKAQCNLGFCYAEGHGVPQDYAQAVHWYRKAAEETYENAQCKLGWCYLYGKGVSRNVVLAYKWLRLAAEQGYPGAKEQLTSLSAFISPAELAEGERLYKEY